MEIHTACAACGFASLRVVCRLAGFKTQIQISSKMKKQKANTQFWLFSREFEQGMLNSPRELRRDEWAIRDAWDEWHKWFPPISSVGNPQCAIRNCQRLPAKRFSLLHFCFFCAKTVFTRSLQGFFHGRTPLFPACKSYPRCVVAFSQSMP